VKLRGWPFWCIAALASTATLAAQSFTRPGTIFVTEVVGTATVTAGGTTKPLAADARVRAEATVATERSSTLTLELSNGTTLRLGTESEVVIEEFWQDPHSVPGKPADWNEEPSPSRTAVRLVRGDVTVAVKRLRTARGASFAVGLPAGTVQISEGELRVRARMTEIGIGVCRVDLRSGAGEFEAVGRKPGPLVPGKPVELAVEIDRTTGVVSVGEMPAGK
jgi:ferric-dicitrate binding protein FerR (iron transport regulator)